MCNTEYNERRMWGVNFCDSQRQISGKFYWKVLSKNIESVGGVKWTHSHYKNFPTAKKK